MSGDKRTYKEFCEQRQSEVPLFQQYWWMETVCAGKQWDVSLAFDGARLAGAMPYHYGRKYGLAYIIPPQLTQFSGPLYLYPEGVGESHRREYEKEVTRQLLRPVEALRPAVFVQSLSPEVTNWLPFYWAGYSQRTRYTYRLDDISDTERLFAAFDSRERQRKIKKFAARTTVRYDMTPAAFATFHGDYWRSRGGEDCLSAAFIERVCAAAIGRGQGVIASLHDDDGRLLAARFAVYDERCAHTLMSAADMRLHRSGHSETLVWFLLKYLSGKTAAFDFEGSMDEGVEYFYRSFGARQVPYFEIRKSRNFLFDILMKNK